MRVRIEIAVQWGIRQRASHRNFPTRISRNVANLLLQRRLRTNGSGKQEKYNRDSHHRTIANTIAYRNREGARPLKAL
jgi:hypothetical protein